MDSTTPIAHAILVINCGSSSVKFAVLDAIDLECLASGLVERIGATDASMHWKVGDQKAERSLPDVTLPEALASVIEVLPEGVEVIGVGHRVVHGGERFSASVRVDDSVISGIEACSSLAPLHGPANLAGIEAARAVFPKLPQVVVFDTAFHQTLPPHAYRYAVPTEWYESHRVRRYGFHGTSHHYVAEQAALRIGRPFSELGLVIAHLGNGCSACAVWEGESVDTTMGLSPLEGLVMGTRSGDVDPALHGFLATQLGWSLDRITAALNQESGLLGLSGLSNDMRTLVEASESGHDRASLAIAVFSYRLARSLAGLTAALPKLDAIVFTGGIGENSAPIRAMAASHLQVLGVSLDAEANAVHGAHSNGRISLPEARPCYVIATNEELMIARETLELISS